MVLFTDPKQVTNWLDPIEKNYTEQKKQRQLHYSQSKEVWAQQEAATFTAGDFDQVLKGLSSLSKTAKQISTDREERKYTDFVKGYEQLKFSDQEKIEQIASETDLSLNDANLLKTLSKSGNISPEALIYLEQQSGSKALRLKRLLGWQTVEKSVATLDSEIEQNLYGIRDNFNEAERTGKVDIFYRNALTDKLRKLGLNDRFIATHYEGEINKFSETKGLSSKLDYKTVEFSKDAAERIATFENLKYGTDPTTAATTLSEFLSKQISLDPENGRNKTIIFMHRLMKDGKIDGSVIQAMKEGKLSGKALEDGFKIGKDLISDSDWRYIEQGEREYQTAVLTNHNDSWAAQGLAARTAVIKNEWTQEQFESFLRKAKDNGQENQQWYKDLSNININRQNDTVKNAEKKSIRTSIISGDVAFLKREKERVTNSTLKDEIQDQIDLLENKQAEFNYTETHIDVAVGKRLSLTIGEDGGVVLPRRALKVRNDLLSYFRQRFQARISEQPPNTNAFNDALDDTEAYWDRNGGNAKVTIEGSDEIDPKAGKFTPNSKGEFKFYDTYSKARSIRSKGLYNVVDDQELNTIKTNLLENLYKAEDDSTVPGKTAVERLLNTPEAVLTGSDLKAVYENNQVSQKIIVQAKLLGVTVANLIKQQYDALKNNDPNNILRNLDQSQIDDCVNPLLYVEDVLNRTNSIDLLSKLKRKGIQDFTPKEALRLRKILEEEEAKIRLEATTKPLEDTQIGRYNTRS